MSSVIQMAMLTMLCGVVVSFGQTPTETPFRLSARIVAVDKAKNTLKVRLRIKNVSRQQQRIAPLLVGAGYSVLTESSVLTNRSEPGTNSFLAFRDLRSGESFSKTVTISIEDNFFSRRITYYFQFDYVSGEQFADGAQAWKGIVLSNRVEYRSLATN